MAKDTPTPAQRARARRDPAITLPPAPSTRDGTPSERLRRLELRVAGKRLLIGPAIEGDPDVSATIRGVQTITLAVRDIDGTLQRELADEALLLQGAVTMLDGDVVYVVQSAAGDGGLITLVVEDQVAWRMRQFDSFLAVSRADATFGQFAARLIDEASSPPLTYMQFWCPEVDTKTRIAAPDADQG